MNYYEVLDIPPAASADEVRRAYRELAEIHHPDRMRGLRAEVQQRAEARLRLLNEAYTVLRDPMERARYDALLTDPAPASDGSIVAKAKPGEARGKLRQRLAMLDEQIGECQQQLAQLRPQTGDQGRLDTLWERYLFASLGLALPFAFAGLLASNRWEAEPTAAGVGALGTMALFGYGALGLVAGFSRSPLRGAPLAWLLLGMPALLLALLGAVWLDVPRTARMVGLFMAYGALVWRIAGQPLAARRDASAIRLSHVRRLEEELYTFQAERQRLQGEMARYSATGERR